MEFEIKEQFKQLPSKEDLLEMCKNADVEAFPVTKAKADVVFDTEMSIEDFINLARKFRSPIYYCVKNYKCEQFMIFPQPDDDDIWQLCSSDYDGVILNRINHHLLKYGTLPTDEETKRHSERKDSGAIILYNLSVVQSNINLFVQEIDLYYEYNTHIYKLAKKVDVTDYLKDLDMQVRQLHQEVTDEVDKIYQQTQAEQEPQEEEDDEYAVDEPVANIFVQQNQEE